MEKLKEEYAQREKEQQLEYDAKMKTAEANHRAMNRQQLERELQLLNDVRDKVKQELAIVQKKVDTAARINEKTTNAIEKEIARQSRLNFSDVKDGGVLVLLGVTGVGKSTLTNRLCGDTSSKGDEGPAKTSSGCDSCTTDPKIIKCTRAGKSVYIVDSGGFADTERRDLDHTNNLCNFLKGSGGINTFVLLINFKVPRWTPEFIDAIRAYEEAFGPELYLHLIIVVTNVDTDDDRDDWEIEGKDDEIRDTFEAKLRLKSRGKMPRVPIPVIPVGRDAEACKLALQQLDGLLGGQYKNKFGLARLKSPLDSLIERQKVFLNRYKAERCKLLEVETELTAKQGQIAGVEERLSSPPLPASGSSALGLLQSVSKSE